MIDEGGNVMTTTEPTAGDSSAWNITPIENDYLGLFDITRSAHGLCLVFDGSARVRAGTVEAPAASTGAASGVTETAATLGGEADPRTARSSACRFEYGISTGYGSSAPCATTPEGSGAKPVSALLTGLTKNTTYHYRLVVGNAGGTTDGADQTFKTLADAADPGPVDPAPGPTPGPSPDPNPNPTPNPAPDPVAPLVTRASCRLGLATARVRLTGKRRGRLLVSTRCNKAVQATLSGTVKVGSARGCPPMSC